MSIRKILNSLEKSWERDHILLDLKKGLGTDEIVNEFLVKNERQIKELNSLLRPEDIDLLNQVEQLSTCESQLINKIKDLNVESNRILLACKKLGINAKGATKRLNKEELEKIKSYFETGKNLSDEVINLNKVKTKSSSKKIVEKVKIKYFANRLIRKS